MSNSGQPKQQEKEPNAAEATREEAQIRKLKHWTEKSFPIGLRDKSKTPFLNQFSNLELREGLIHAVTTSKELQAELEKLIDISDKQYSDTKNNRRFRDILDKIEKDLTINTDDDVLVDGDVLEEEDHATAIRQWENFTGFDDERMLRYTICVVSRKNDKMRWHIKEYKRSIGVAQGMSRRDLLMARQV